MNMMSIDCTLSRRLENIKLRWQSAAFYVAYFLYFLKMHVFCEKISVGQKVARQTTWLAYWEQKVGGLLPALPSRLRRQWPII